MTSQLEFVARLKAEFNLHISNGDLQIVEKLNKKIKIFHIVLVLYIISSILIAIGFTVHYDKLSVKNPTK